MSESQRNLSAEECISLARKSLKAERLGTALDWYYQAVTTEPQKAEYRAEMVTATMLPMGLEKQAFVEAVRAIHIDPQCAKAFRALACAEYTIGRTKDAVESFDKQLQLAPSDPQAMLDRANVAMDFSEHELAESLCRRILESENIYGGEALHYLALCAYRQGKYEEAIEVWNWALEAKCFYPEVVKWNQSLAMLCIGNYREGWKLHQARARSQGDIYSMEMFRRGGDKVVNDHFPPGPARMHLAQEMGFGDCLIMLRYLPLLAERGYKLTLEVDSALVGLLQYNCRGVNVVRKAPDFPGTVGLPPFDHYVPLLNLPVLFRTEVNSIPPQPVLKADPLLIEKYACKLAECPGYQGRAIGLCWSSGLFTSGPNARWHGEFNRRKSVPFEKLVPILDARFVSLQVGPSRNRGVTYEIRDLPPYKINDVLPDEPTWMDTAALISCLELVITVDTGVAHLAASMGKPVWLMMHTECAWPWLAERPGATWNERSPWYPTVRLFRQKKAHEWGGVIERIAAELRSRKSAAA